MGDVSPVTSGINPFGYGNYQPMQGFEPRIQQTPIRTAGYTPKIREAEEGGYSYQGKPVSVDEGINILNQNRDILDAYNEASVDVTSYVPGAYDASAVFAQARDGECHPNIGGWAA